MQFGFYYILPLTAASVTSAPDAVASPAIIASSTDPCEITIGDYNVSTPSLAQYERTLPNRVLQLFQVENMAPRSRHIPRIADHIANYLNSPDIVFVQEIQDDSGSSDNGVVSANKTLGALTKAIAKASGGVQYEFVNVPPLNNMDGGKPGSNIRVAYLYVYFLLFFSS